MDRLEGVPDEKRTARFVCAIAAAFPDGTVKIRGMMEGIIGHRIAERTDLAMIRSFICRNSAVRQQNFPKRRKMRATEEKD